MKFTCRTEQLKMALAMLGRVVPAKPPKDILRAIRLSVRTDTVSIEGNDAENALRMEISCNNSTSGLGLLEFAKLRPIVDSFTEPETIIDIGDTKATVSAGTSRFTLGTGRTDEFPAFPEQESQSRITMNGGEWCRAIARLEPFSVPAAASPWRGVSIESSDANGVWAVASNASGGCLGCEKLDAKIEGPYVKVLISERGSRLMAAVLEGHPGDCVIHFSKSTVSVETPMGMAICRLNEGKFHENWRKFYKFEAVHQESFLREPMLTALTQAIIPLTDSSRRLHFRFSDNTLTLSASVEGNASEVKIPFAWAGAELEVTYSGELVKNVIASFPQGAQIVMSLVADEKPIRFESGSIGFMCAGMERQV